MKKFKKQLSVFSILLFLFSTYFILSYDGNTFTSDNKVYAATVSKTVKVTSISLNKTKNTITVGGKETLKATVSPSNATNKKVTWSTSNSKVAAVSNGVVTAVGKGTATITVTTADGKKTAKYIVTVNPVVKVTSVKLNKTKNVLTIGKKDTLVSIVSPSNAANKGVTWSTSNSKVATVSNGVVTAVGRGTANIKVTTVDGKKTASYSVTVNPVVQAAPAVKVTSIVLNKTFSNLTLGEWDKLYAYEFLSPSSGTYQNITWKTSNSKVATVSSKGEVTTVGSGTVVISATAGGKTAKCTVTVKNPVAVKSIILNKTSSSLSIGSTDSLYANLLPVDASGMGVVWKTSNSKVATVTSYGEVKAVSLGKATITATTQDGSKSVNCSVTVTAAVKVRSVALNTNAITLTVGDYSDYLHATISPSTATNKDVTWKTSNSKVVTVEDNYYGYKRIRAVGAGTATITVTTKDGSKASSCIVTVNAAVKAPALSSITLNKTTDTLAVGTTDSLNATLNPYNTAYQTIGWTTSNPKVALVNSSGDITAVGVGKAVITATSDDGKKSASCTITVNPAVKIKSITLNKTTSTLNVGGYDWLNAIVSPDNATNQSVIWSTSNANVATVSYNGYVNAVGTGKATITATTVDGNKTATCVVTVNPPIKVTSVKFYMPSATLNIGETSWLNTQVYPVNAANKNLTWSTSNSKVVTVDSNGNVTAVSAGKATITVTAVDGNKKATCIVTVNPPVKVTGVALYTTSTTLTVGDSSWLSARIYPSNATNASLTWTSSNSKVAAVDSSGNVKAISAGKATITVTTVDGKKTAICNVVVKDIVKVSSVAINKTSDTLVVGNSHYLNATVYPYDAVNQIIMWTTSDAKVVTVSSNGEITAVAAGTATITATTEDGSKVATCKVTVNGPVKVTSVALSRVSTILSIGNTDYIYAKVSPTDAVNQNVIWTTSDANVAIIDENNGSNITVKGVAAGTATITATTEDGSKTATCKVTVNGPIKVQSVSLNRETDTLTIGETDNLQATINPYDAENKNVAWTTSNSKVAAVDLDGRITAIGEGTATITVTTEDGKKTASCIVTVNLPVKVTSVALSKVNSTLMIGNTDYIYAKVLPTNAANQAVKWTTSDSNVVIVYDSYDSSTSIKGIAAGTATITATTLDGSKVATCTVTVNGPVKVTSVVLNRTKDTLIVGKTDKLSATIYPYNAANQNVIWTTSDANIVTVGYDGDITAVAAGTATITATTEDGSKTATCVVTVNPPVKVTSVTLNTTKETLVLWDSLYLSATVNPNNAENTAVTWTTSNTDVASVDRNGWVTPTGIGTATITATTDDGGKTATCVVTVVDSYDY